MYGILSADMSVYHVCVSGAQGGQRSLLNPPGLELQMAPSCHIGVENQIQVLTIHSLFKKDVSKKSLKHLLLH